MCAGRNFTKVSKGTFSIEYRNLFRITSNWNKKISMDINSDSVDNAWWDFLFFSGLCARCYPSVVVCVWYFLGTKLQKDFELWKDYIYKIGVRVFVCVCHLYVFEKDTKNKRTFSAYTFLCRLKRMYWNNKISTTRTDEENTETTLPCTKYKYNKRMTN